LILNVIIIWSNSFIVDSVDKEVYEKVQSRFSVKIAEMPDEIDLAAYLPKPGVKERYDD
jgi:hypothetical protein